MRSYSSPFGLGHPALKDLFDGEIFVQEKVDGSQFSFGVIDGELVCRSRGRIIPDLQSADMFQPGVNVVIDLFERGLLPEGWTYRGEYLRKPKQNTLAYDRIPANHIIIFDIDQGDQDYIMPKALPAYLEHMGLEATPLFYQGKMDNNKATLEVLNSFMDRTSVLGNQKIEGIVIKNYAKYDDGAKVLMGKLVSKDFKEKHSKDWKNRNPSQASFIGKIIEELATDARWRKAIQHLEEAGELEFEPRDIPKVIKEVSQDVFKDEAEELKERLFKHFWKQISRGIIKGLPEFYKNWLVERMMNDGTTEPTGSTE
jgi:hypothetical protein